MVRHGNDKRLFMNASAKIVVTVIAIANLAAVCFLVFALVVCIPFDEAAEGPKAGERYFVTAVLLVLGTLEVLLLRRLIGARPSDKDGSAL
ncbi:MAG: hypothetical protein RDV48_20990 [Candidatus Eremiobacteraeota bacterium]|nr:hypothetical protein [Candidatus Eremiobacteraeota bacterium]